ncbi:MAG: tetratricopeptide repeat protein, partial [Bacteroidales bacterium]|nr:tetratricopeptide repeat protein [Bacteroidales bacterium]
MKKLFAILFILILPVCVFGQSEKADNLYNEGLKLYESKQYQSAISLFQKSDELDKKQLSPTSENYHRAEIAIINCWNDLAKEYASAENFAEAIRLQTLVVERCEKIFGILHSDYFTVLTTLTEYQIQSGNHSDADDTFMEGIKYANSDQLDMATVQFEISNTLEKKEYDETSPYYHRSEIALLKCWDIYVNYYAEAGNYEEAIKYQGLYVRGIKDLMGEMSSDYAQSLSSLAFYYANLGNYTEAIKIGTQATEKMKKILGEEHPDYAMSLSNLALYNSEIGNYTEAIRLETISLEILKKVLGEEHPNYARSLSNLAGYNAYIGNYTEA